MVVTLTGCGLLPTRTVEVEVPRNVYIEVEKPIFVPESLLTRCEPDPQIQGTDIRNEDISIQSLERKARLERCSQKVDAIRDYNETMRQHYESTDAEETEG